MAIPFPTIFAYDEDEANRIRSGRRFPIYVFSDTITGKPTPIPD